MSFLKNLEYRFPTFSSNKGALIFAGKVIFAIAVILTVINLWIDLSVEQNKNDILMRANDRMYWIETQSANILQYAPRSAQVEAAMLLLQNKDMTEDQKNFVLQVIKQSVASGGVQMQPVAAIGSKSTQSGTVATQTGATATGAVTQSSSGVTVETGNTATGETAVKAPAKKYIIKTMDGKTLSGAVIK